MTQADPGRDLLHTETGPRDLGISETTVLLLIDCGSQTSLVATEDDDDEKKGTDGIGKLCQPTQWPYFPTGCCDLSPIPSQPSLVCLG